MGSGMFFIANSAISCVLIKLMARQYSLLIGQGYVFRDEPMPKVDPVTD